MKEKIEARETIVKQQLEQLRTKLNEGRIRYNNNQSDWQYYPSLVHTETKLKELLDFFNIDSKNHK